MADSSESQLPLGFFDEPKTTLANKATNEPNASTSRKLTDEELLAEFESELQPLVQPESTTTTKEEGNTKDVEATDPVLVEIDKNIKESEEAFQVAKSLLKKLQSLKRKANLIAEKKNKNKKVESYVKENINASMKSSDGEETDEEEGDNWRKLKV